MKNGKILISAIFLLVFIFNFSNSVIAEDENIIMTDPKDDVYVIGFSDVNVTTTDEFPNIDIEKLTYIHNDGSKKVTVMLQVFGEIEDRGSIDETDIGESLNSVAYIISLITDENEYTITYVNKKCILSTDLFGDSENITDWVVTNDILTVNFDLESADETFIEINAQTNEIDFEDLDFESGGFYFDSIPNLLSVEIIVAKNIEEIGNTIQFTADVQDDLGISEDFTYIWDFGDDSQTSNLKNPLHTYNSIGNYTVTLTVEDNFGTIASNTTIIQIIEKSDNNGNGSNGGGNNQNGNGSESGLNLFITIIAVIIIIGILVLIFIIRR